MYVGGQGTGAPAPAPAPASADAMAAFGVDYVFGCQTSETGLFRSQLENGIMGFSMGADSFPAQLRRSGATDSGVFGLCFSFGGGLLTLGGVDASIHTPGAPLQYAKLVKSSNWYGVRVLDMKLSAGPGGAEVGSVCYLLVHTISA
jgi:hypothetical protein